MEDPVKEEKWALGPEYYQYRLIEALYNEYNLAAGQRPQLACNNAPVFMNAQVLIPSFGDKVTVEKVCDDIIWSCEIPADLEDVSSLISDRFVVPVQNKTKIRHELVASSLSGAGTDVKLKEVFQAQNDNDDDLTPDLIFEDPEGIFHVVEFTTTRSDSEYMMTRAFEEKKFKYYMALNNRAIDKVITYTPIVVSHRTVVSNLQLPQSVVDELIIRMNLAIALENYALGVGILLHMTETEELLSKTAQEINFTLERIENKEPRKSGIISIDNAYIESILCDPDMSQVHDSYLESRLRALPDLRKTPNLEDQKAQYIESLKDCKRTRRVMKPVCNLPLVIPPRTKDTQKPEFRAINTSGPNEPLLTLWEHCLRLASLKKGEWMEEDKKVLRAEAMEHDPKKVELLEEQRHKHRGKYHRVSFKSIKNTKLLKYLAKDGLFGKRFSREVDHKARQKEQKKSFHFDTDTDDITKFIKSCDLFENLEGDRPEYFEKTIGLLDLAGKMAMNSSINTELLRLWSETKLFNLLEFYSDIALELAISCKQYSKPDEMILKKLRYWDCYLLIHNTGSKSHIFYSLMFPKRTKSEVFLGFPFKPVITTTFHYFTEFSSFRVDKLENIASMGASLLAFIAFYSDFYNLPSLEPSSFKNHPEASQMLLLTMLTRLEDKAETEESMTLVRYMYMEVFKSSMSLSKPDPFKILKKMTTKPRSRLNLWAIKRIINSFYTMAKFPPQREVPEKPKELLEGEDALPGDEWSGLMNCFTYGHITTATAAVNLMYLGYVKNKNEVAQGNVEFKLIEKVIEEEMTLDMSQKGVQKSRGEATSHDRPGPKQFNKNCIIHGCTLMEKQLGNTLGPEWKKILERDILESLSRQLTHEIATLKASSTCKHQKGVEKVTLKNNPELHRIKVIEAIATKIEKIGLNPFINLNTIIEEVESSSGGVIADLFKKNQHGGIREIYVLPIESRILQLFIEVISRVLCSYFDEETLTHPSNKMRILDRHKVRTARIAKARDTAYADYCNSSDKTRWNQNFVMPALALPLFRLTTTKFHNAIQRIMNLWADKLIRIPPPVCSLLLSKTKLESAAYMDLLEKFWNPKKTTKSRAYIQEQCSAFVNLTSGMMQGILHYTSSLLHLSFLFSGKSLIKTTLKKYHKDWYFVISQVCSSDDSATILSMISPHPPCGITRGDIQVMVQAELSLLSLQYYCEYFCMRESTKSTFALYDYIEFNSEFLFKNTLAKPLIKITAACIGLTEAESFMKRFHTMYNLLMDLFSSGMPSRSTSFTQLAQGWMHYKSMGASTNGLYFDWCKLIMEFPDPVHGFFLLDNELLCGVMGFSFMYWLATEHNLNLIKSVSLLQNEELEDNREGGVVKSLIVKNGSLRKWHQLMDRLESGSLNPKSQTFVWDKKNQTFVKNKEKVKERAQLFEDEYELLFRHPNNLKELRTKLLMKASMPGVSGSLGKGNPFLQSLAMSAYSINTHCFTKVSISSEMTGAICKEKKKVEKTNLLLEISTTLKRIRDIVPDQEAYDTNILLKFPMIERYKEALRIIQSYESASLIPVHRLRQRKNLVVLQPRTVPLPLTLLQVVNKLWFGFNLKVSDRVYRRCLETYQHSYPWLRDTFKATLSASPLQTAVELHQFVSSKSDRTRKLTLCGPGIYSNVFEGQINQIIRKYYLRGYLLDKHSGTGSKQQSLDLPMCELALSLLIPINRVRTLTTKSILRTKINTDVDLDHIANYNKRDMSALVCAIALKEEKSMEEIFDMLREKRVGKFVTFPRMQVRVGSGAEVKWTGPGEAQMFIDGEMLRIMMNDDEATELIVSSYSRMRLNPGLLAEALHQLNLRTPRKDIACNRSICRFNGHRFVPNTSRGIPVTEDRHMTYIHYEPKGAQFKVFKGACGIYTRVMGSWKPVIEFTTGPKDMSFSQSRGEVEKLWDAWVQQSVLSHASAIKLILQLMDQLQERYTTKEDPQELKRWVKQTLENRLKYRGIGHACYDFTNSIYSTEEQNLTEEEDDMDDMLLEMMEEQIFMDGGLDILIDEREAQLKEDIKNHSIRELASNSRSETGVNIESVLQTVETMDFDLYNVDVGLYQVYFHNLNEDLNPYAQSVIRRDTFNHLYMHPLWDGFIDYMLNLDHKFFDKLFKGITSMFDEKMSRCLMEIMGIKEKARETAPSDIYKGGKDVLMDIYMEKIEESAQIDSDSSEED